MKDSIQQIVRDTRNLLLFHQSLDIDNYPASAELKKLLRSAPKVALRSPKKSPTTDTDLLKQPTLPSTSTASLTDIKIDLGDCTRCSLYKNRTSILFGSGAQKTKLFIIGEWPNTLDDQAGVLFSGNEGEMLDKMLINVLKLEREEVYISSIIKCLVMGEKPPTREQINSCLPFINRQIEAVNPDIICTMGTTAAQTLLKTNKPLIRLRGHFHDFKGISLMPTFHPTFLLNNPEMKKAAFIDLQMISQKLAKTKS